MLTRTLDRSGSGLPAGVARLWRRWTHRPARATMPVVATEHEPAKELWTARRLAAWLGISRQALHSRMEHGTIRPHYIAKTDGGRVIYLFDPTRVKRWREPGP